MSNNLKNNPLACGLLGVIIGAGGTLGGQTILNNSFQKVDTTTSVNQIYSPQNSKPNSNFDIVPYDPNGDVYITPHGHKYHYSDCYTLSNSTELQQVSSEEAQKAGINPCSKCNPN